MRTITRYPTRPLECWGKMKELYHQHLHQGWTVKQRGGVAIIQIGEFMPALFSGLGEFALRIYRPYFDPAAKDPTLLTRYHEMAEVAGYPAGEMCSTMHYFIAQLLSSAVTRDPRDGSPAPVDLAFQVNFCGSPVKMGQLASEVLGVPFFVVDIPQEATPGAAVKYVTEQLYDAIDWLCRVTGREYNDERLVEGAKIEWENATLWSRICELGKAIPAPLDFHLLRQLCVPTVYMRSHPETVEFNRMLLDEVKQRVEEGISVTGYETCRLFYEGQEMFFNRDDFFTYPHPYGAGFFHGRPCFVRGAWEVGEDGTFMVARTPAERGIEIKDRASALQSLAELYVERAPNLSQMLRLTTKPEGIIKRAQDWRADAVVLHLDIGCRAIVVGFMEVKQALKEAGIPVFTFEGSTSDPRYYSDPQVVEGLRSFLEGLGLTRLSETPRPTWG